MRSSVFLKDAYQKFTNEATGVILLKEVTIGDRMNQRRLHGLYSTGSDGRLYLLAFSGQHQHSRVRHQIFNQNLG